LFRKDAAALEAWNESLVSLCSARQHRIISEAWPSLKKDGLLIYSTCSFSQAENEWVVDWVADELCAETVPIPVPEEWGIVKTLSPRLACHGFRFLPNKLAGEGFYLSVLKKTAASESFHYSLNREKVPTK